jgi:hypothetical protein
MNEDSLMTITSCVCTLNTSIINIIYKIAKLAMCLNAIIIRFITAFTALTPEVGGASENRDLSVRRNSITNREYTETYAYTIFGLSF